MNIQCIILLYYVIHICGFLNTRKNTVSLSKLEKKIKCAIYDYQYDWTSGEVAWEYDNINDIDNKYDDTVFYNTNNIIETELININPELSIKPISTINTINTNLVLYVDGENKIIWNAVTSGIMKGVYIQIITIDNVIAYMQCYTNTAVEMNILLSILYIIFYEKFKVIEKKNIVTLKHYNNINLFEKYMKIRRNSSIIVVITYILFFRGISNAE